MYLASVEGKWSPSSSTLWTRNRSTTIDGNCVSGIPGRRGFSMSARNGYDATASLSRGSVGYRISGSFADPPVDAPTAAPASFRNSRRLIMDIYARPQSSRPSGGPEDSLRRHRDRIGSRGRHGRPRPHFSRPQSIASRGRQATGHDERIEVDGVAL